MSSLSAITSATALESLDAGEVTDLQTALEKLGYSVTADGILGPITSAAWARFKSDNGLNQPDTIGPASAALLLKRAAADVSPSIPAPALAIIEFFEGLELTSYPDPGTGAAPWTIGYGTTVYPDGTKVQPDQNITEAQALAYLDHDLQTVMTALPATVPYWTTMNVDQQSALISFAYNLGAYFYGTGGFNSISSALGDHRWSDVPSTMALYSNPGTPAHDGLLKRRIAEGDLWQGEGPYAAATVA